MWENVGKCEQMWENMGKIKEQAYSPAPIYYTLHSVSLPSFRYGVWLQVPSSF